MSSDEEPGGPLVLLGLGANLGDPLAQLARAVDEIEVLADVDRVSTVYRTAPVGHADQPDFYNLVVACHTGLPPAELLRRTGDVEARLGRVRTLRDGPRTIDIDLLAYGGKVMRTGALTLPHPRLHLRGFVLHPLAEVAPEWRHPVLGRTARELLSAAAGLERVEAVGALARAPLAPARPPG
jgi:2-amino-4-hydroxy-6-hydroxymethyldihydropteridine diphosphokinase